MMPMMMEPVSREQQRQEERKAMVVAPGLRLINNHLCLKLMSSSHLINVYTTTASQIFPCFGLKYFLHDGLCAALFSDHLAPVNNKSI